MLIPTDEAVMADWPVQIPWGENMGLNVWLLLAATDTRNKAVVAT